MSMPSREGFKIRVITPFIAKSFKDASSIPLLADGRIFDGCVTLHEIKALIIGFLGLSVNILVDSQGYQECNCMFARRIHKCGHWEKIECCGHYGESGKCSYNLNHGQASMSASCAICDKPLPDHGYGEPTCGRVFFRTDTSCGHAFHSYCLGLGNTWSCPENCLSCKL